MFRAGAADGSVATLFVKRRSRVLDREPGTVVRKDLLGQPLVTSREDRLTSTEEDR